MNRTTIMLPETLKMKASKLAMKRGVSFGELVREALELVCRSEGKHTYDAFYEDRRIYKVCRDRDLAEKHDDYLYDE
ncbi:MAG: hypothetical protein ACE365_02360 [Gammaproteobacteria bacterium]